MSFIFLIATFVEIFWCKLLLWFSLELNFLYGCKQIWSWYIIFQEARLSKKLFSKFALPPPSCIYQVCNISSVDKSAKQHDILSSCFSYLHFQTHSLYLEYFLEMGNCLNLVQKTSYCIYKDILPAFDKVWWLVYTI